MSVDRKLLHLVDSNCLWLTY